MRFALLGCAVIVMLVFAAPASAQEPTGSCIAGAVSGTKQSYTCRLGPIVVAPYQVLTRDALFNPPKPVVDGHITDMSVDVVDGDGSPVPINRLMLHHIVFLNAGAGFGEKRDPTCGDGFLLTDWKTLAPNVGERFYGAGEERAELSLPPGYGYPIARDDSWLMTYMFMNHRAKVDRAYIQYEVTVDTAPGLTPVKPIWLDVGDVRGRPGLQRAGRRETRSDPSPQRRVDRARGGTDRGGRRPRARRREEPDRAAP